MLSERISYRRDLYLTDKSRIQHLVHSAGIFSPQEIEIALELVEERLTKGIKCGYHFLLAELSDTVVGYTCFGPIPGSVHSHDLYWIIVHHRYRRQGIGRTLLSRTEYLVRQEGGRILYIDTSSRDQYRATREFYAACGYQQEAVLKDFYGPDDSKIIFAKILSPYEPEKEKLWS